MKRLRTNDFMTSTGVNIIPGIKVVVPPLAALLISSCAPAAEHDTAEPTPEVEEGPVSIQEEAWEWAPSSPAEAVLPGETGPIIATSSGAIGLDPDDGDELWSYQNPDINELDIESDEYNVGVTPDGAKVVLAWVGENLFRSPVEVVVLDSGSGELIHQYSYSPSDDMDTDELTAPQLHNLSHEAWIEPTSDGFIGRNISDGDVRWTYEPSDDCRVLPGYDPEEQRNPNVVTSEESYIFTEECDEESPDDHSFSYADLLSLDADTGKVNWSVDSTVVLDEYSESAEDEPPRTSLSLLSHQHHIGVTTNRGRSVIDARDGSFVFDDLTEFSSDSVTLDEFVDVSSGQISRLTHPGIENDGPTSFSLIDPQEQEQVESSSLPGSYSVPHIFDTREMNPANNWARTVVLEQGVLTATCEGSCERTETNGAAFLPWGDSEPQFTVELPDPEDSSDFSDHRFLLTGAGVAAFQVSGDRNMVEHVSFLR